MLEYKVRIDPQNGVVIYGDFIPGSIAVNIPDVDKKKRQYISLFLIKKDIECGIDYLRCISLNNHPIANEGLFISALAMFAKCFVESGSRGCLDKAGFKKFSPESATLFDKYDAWRNKHFLHDENRMTEAISFLLISPEGSESVLGGPPSVVWNSVQVDYIQESRQLECLLQEVWKYVVHKIDKHGESIAKDYCSRTREELLEFGEAKVTLATMQNPEVKR